jgi:hypothetical protein
VLLIEPTNVYDSRTSPRRLPVSTSHPALKEFHDGRIAYFVREHAGTAIPLWRVVNHVVELDRPGSDPERRRITLVVLDRIKALLKARFLVRCARTHVALAGVPVQNPPTARTRVNKQRRRKQLSVLYTREATTVHLPPLPAEPVQTRPNSVQRPVLADCAEDCAAARAEGKTESGLDCATDRLRAAALELASLPRRQKRSWTGWIGGIHVWRGRKLVLPDGRVRTIYAAIRGCVALTPEPGERFDPRELLFSASRVLVWKRPAAQVLGRAKRGVRERKSAAKAMTARRNGCYPVKPGSKPRGRPKLPRSS